MISWRTSARLVVLLIVGSGSPLLGDPPRLAERDQAYRSSIQPVLKKYCVECHNQRRAEGEIDFESFQNMHHIYKARPTWRKVLTKLRSEEMPPQDSPKPSSEERTRVIEWIDGVLNEVDCGDPDPGRVTIRRLNRFEYRNTIRDLLGVDYEPAVDFPGDDVGYGFDNIGDVLSLPTLLMEKYLRAADDITRKAIVTTDLEVAVLGQTPVDKLKPDGGSPFADGGRILSSQGEIAIHVDIPQAAEYELRVQAFGHQAGDEPVKMECRLDGKAVEIFEVKATEQKPEIYKRKGAATAGKHKISLAFMNDYYKPEAADPNQRDRNLIVKSIAIVGPLGTQKSNLPDSHRRVFFVQPDQNLPVPQAARKIIERFASRAYRRPATESELHRLMKLFEFAHGQGDNFEECIRFAMQAILVSPHFLYKIELDPGPGDTNGVRLLDEFELATRLSYFLWSSMPDDELLLHAWRGTLRKDGNLEAQVRRLLKDPKSQALVRNFALQWLQLRRLDDVAPDSKRFPSFNEKLRDAMRTETEMLFAHVMRENRSIIELLNADYTFINEPLAQHYGISGIQGDEFRKISLSGYPRRGLITHASVLTVTSNPTRTSLVKRGKWILDNIVGEPPPPPAPNVPDLMEGEQAEMAATLRQRMEQHRANPSCASCHMRMDALGFALENFDAIGGWRTKDGAFPVDAIGALPSGEKFNGPQELVQMLSATQRDAFAHCLTEKLLTYGLGRGLEYYDSCAVDKLTKAISQDDYRFTTLVLGIVTSEPFQKRRSKRDTE